MATPKSDQEVVKKGREGIGTFVGVGFVGVVILVTYIVMYGLYMARL